MPFWDHSVVNPYHHVHLPSHFVKQHKVASAMVNSEGLPIGVEVKYLTLVWSLAFF